MKTAVQWLFEEYKKREIATDEMVELFEKAEHREKEQIIEAVYHTCNAMSHSDLPCGQEYYNKIFKSE